MNRGWNALHRRAAEVEVIDDEIRELIEDMYVTQDAAHGVGLAAPQVGVGLRIFTWTFPDSGDAPNVGHVINPVLSGFLNAGISQVSVRPRLRPPQTHPIRSLPCC